MPDRWWNPRLPPVEGEWRGQLVHRRGSRALRALGFAAIALSLGLVLLEIVAAALIVVDPGPRPELELGGLNDVVFAITVLFTFGIFALGPIAWATANYRPGLAAIVRYLRLGGVRPEFMPYPALWLVLPFFASIALVVVTLVIVNAVAAAFGQGIPENEALIEVARGMPGWLVPVVGIGAGVGEEIFFRGFLYRVLGPWGQAVVFGLAHMSYNVPQQVVGPFLLGLFYAYVTRYSGSLWPAIIAHAAYDIFALSVVKMVPDDVWDNMAGAA